MEDKKPPMRNKFVGQGMLLFFDQLMVGVTNWLYWLVISRFTLASEIGQATSVYSLVLLLATLSQIGLEYPLLKKSSLPRSQILGTALTIELILILGFYSCFNTSCLYKCISYISERIFMGGCCIACSFTN